MPAASHPPMSRVTQLRWVVAVLVVLALASGLAWGALALCQMLILILLLYQAARGGQAAPALLHAASAARLPKISLHLAIRDAPPERLGRTLNALARLDYPDLEVLVVDSNTADLARWAAAAGQCARLGARFRFFALGPWPGGRAGALAFARAETAPDAELIGVLRAGDVVDTDWLHRIAAAFADARLGAVAMPLRGAGTDDSAVLLVRAAALDQAGGWVPGFDHAIAELMLRLSGRGWQVLRSEQAAGHTERRQGSPGEAPRRFGQILRRHWRSLLSGAGGAAIPGLPPAIWLADAGHVAAFALCLLWSAALVGFPGAVDFPPAAALVPLLALTAVRIGLSARQSAPSLPAVGDACGNGLAVWCGLLGIVEVPAIMPRHTRLLLLALAGAGVAARHSSGGAAAALWFLLVLALAAPDLAALRIRPAPRRPRHLATHAGD